METKYSICIISYGNLCRKREQRVFLESAENEGYDRGEIEEQDLAKILIGILNWGENLVKREEHREIRLKITGVKNQLILECLTSSGRQNPMSRKLFRGLVKKYNGKIQEKKEKTGKFGLTVILSRYVSL